MADGQWRERSISYEAKCSETGRAVKDVLRRQERPPENIILRL